MNQSFYFLRHGETEWNKKRIAMGQTDIALNECGRAQSYQAQDQLQHIRFKTIFSSPLLRAKETATIIAEEQDCQIILHDDLKEASWGTYEGKQHLNSEWLEEWLSGSAIEGGESFADVQVRVEKTLTHIFTYPEPRLIVAHGAIYWAIQKLLQLPFIDVQNCDPIYHYLDTSNKIEWQRTFIK